MPNHGDINKDLNGSSLSIKGKRVLDKFRNLKVKTVKTNQVTFGNKKTVTSGPIAELETVVTSHEPTGIIITPTTAISSDSHLTIILLNNLITDKRVVLAQVVGYSGDGEPTVSRVTISGPAADIRIYNMGNSATDSPIEVAFFVL